MNFISRIFKPKKIDLRLVGLQDFSKMILLKGEQFDFISKNEGDKRQKFLVRYKILEKPVPNNVHDDHVG